MIDKTQNGKDRKTYRKMVTSVLGESVSPSRVAYSTFDPAKASLSAVLLALSSTTNENTMGPVRITSFLTNNIQL